MVCMWRPEDNFWELVLSYSGIWDWAQLSKFVRQYFLPAAQPLLSTVFWICVYGGCPNEAIYHMHTLTFVLKPNEIYYQLSGTEFISIY